MICLVHGEGITGNDERRALKMLGMIVGVVAVLFVVLPVLFAACVMLMAVLSGAAVLLVAGIHAGGGVLGYVLYRTARKNRIAEEAD